MLEGLEGKNEVWQAGSCKAMKIPGSNKWQLHQAENRYPLLIWDGSEEVKQLKAWLGQSTRTSLSASPSWLAPIALIVGFAAALIGLIWLFAPKLADLAASNIPVEYEVKLGQTARAEILQHEKVDTLKSQFLQTFFDQLSLPYTSSNGARVKLFVVEKDEFNAFALPGRTIVVYTGAIEKMSHYQELMALLGHEYGHVEGRHTLKTLFRGASLYFILSVFVGDVGALGGVLIQQAETLQSLSYSREFEREADAYALKFLCSNQTDPGAAIRLFQLMKKQEKNISQDWAMLRTHPLTDERIENAGKQAKNLTCRLGHPKPVLDSIFYRLKQTPDF